MWGRKTQKQSQVWTRPNTLSLAAWAPGLPPPVTLCMVIHKPSLPKCGHSPSNGPCRQTEPLNQIWCVSRAKQDDSCVISPHQCGWFIPFPCRSTLHHTWTDACLLSCNHCSRRNLLLQPIKIPSFNENKHVNTSAGRWGECEQISFFNCGSALCCSNQGLQSPTLHICYSKKNNPDWWR